MAPARGAALPLLLVLPAVLAGPSAAAPLPPLPDANLSWTDAATLTVGGRGFSDTATFWERLPTAANGTVNRPVYHLAKNSAGMSVRFTTAAETVGVRYRLTSAEVDMWHMPSTGMSGADLYVHDSGNSSWRWVGTCHVIAAGSDQPLPYVLTTFAFPKALRPPGFDGAVRFKLHLPTYNGVTDVAIGVAEGQEAPSPDTPDTVKPIVWYGTSIAQGCCASRPGQIFTNQISRLLSPNRDVINLGFSGSGIMDAGVTSFLAKIDAALFVVDCSWNMQPKDITARAAPLVAYLRSHGHPTTPIVFAEGTTGGQQWIQNSSHPGSSGVIGGIDEPANRAALRAAFAAIVAKTHDINLHHVDGDALYHHVQGGTQRAWLDFIDATVGGVHPSDLGHSRISEFYASFLPPLLAASDARAELDEKHRHERRQQEQEQEQEAGTEKERGQQHQEWQLPAEMQPGLRTPPPPPPPPSRKPGYAYTDFRELRVHGRAFNDTAAGHFFSRLPAAAQADVTPAVWELSLMSTNQYIRFVTDAPSVHFASTTISPCQGMWHMPASGTCYLDLYAFDETVRSWRHVGPIGPGFGGDGGGSPFYDLTGQKALPSAWTGKNTTYLLYLPVRNSLADASAAVGVPAGSYIAGTGAELPPAPGDTAPLLRGGKDQIVWYGTSIQQGGVASRAGNLYDAIIGRRLSREVLNFGFAGNGHDDIGVAKYLVTLNAAVIVLDCLPNMNAASVAAKTVPLVNYLRAHGHATTPIVLAEIPPTTCEDSWFNLASLQKNADMNAALHTAYQNLTRAGDTALHYVRGSQILAPQEGAGQWVNPTVGGTHPSDLGQYWMADFWAGYLPTVVG